MADLGRTMSRVDERLTRLEKMVVLLVEEAGIVLDEAIPFTKPATRAELKRINAEIKAEAESEPIIEQEEETGEELAEESEDTETEESPSEE